LKGRQTDAHAIAPKPLGQPRRTHLRRSAIEAQALQAARELPRTLPGIISP
jgi:hypothetical protein